MLGAVVGNIIGSPYDRENVNVTDFPLFSEKSHFTRDSVMTLGTARALMECMKYPGDVPSDTAFKIQMFDSLRKAARKFYTIGYGRGFWNWLLSKDPHPYVSSGNASAVRVSPVSWAFGDLETVEHFAYLSAAVTHNHEDGLKGACSVAGAVFLARTGKSKDDIRSYITGKYGYDLSRTIDEIRPEYVSTSSCPGTVPEALTAFLEGENFEDVIRKAVSIGGDSDSIAAMAGAVAEPFFGIPAIIQVEAFDRLPPYLQYLEGKWEQWRN